MKRLFSLLIFLTSTVVAAQNIPQELVGKWVIQRELPTRTISCWGEKESKAVIGTEITYTTDSFQWKHLVVKQLALKVAVVTAEQFQTDNSSPSANGSQVSFRQLGIRTPKVKQITINHPPVDFTGATTEMPGDVVLLKNHDIIVLSVCNAYFEAKRLAMQD
jgi:hypothetical protein